MHTLLHRKNMHILSSFDLMANRAIYLEEEYRTDIFVIYPHLKGKTFSKQATATDRRGESETKKKKQMENWNIVNRQYI